MSQQDQDKTEQPTQYRLDEARKQGQVAKSVDLTGGAVMIVFAVVATLTAAGIAASLAQATRGMIALAGSAPRMSAALGEYTWHLYGPLGKAIMPLVLALLVAAVVGNMFQTGPMFTTHPLKPDFKRMNPVQTVKRLFSMRTLWELGKISVRMLLLAGICAFFVWKSRALAESVAMSLPHRLGDLALAAFAKTSLFVLLVIGVVALADLVFSRREFMRRMRMSRRELRDEIKRKDGDPAVKSKQKQQIRELLKKTRSLGRVREADVILTNPTHVAVALQYRPGKMVGPVVLSKGAGMLSHRIRKLAARHGVPMVRVPPLARALYRECDIDTVVPEWHYASLAPVYRELWASKKGGR